MLPVRPLALAFITLSFSCSERSSNEVFIAKKIIADRSGKVTDELYTLIDSDGKQLIEPVDYIISSVNAENNCFITDNDGYQQYFEISSGKPLLSQKFDQATHFTKEGLARVKIQNKWGFVDKQGNQVVPALYDMVGIFSEGLASVLTGSKIGFIDVNGKIVISEKFDPHPNAFYPTTKVAMYEFNEGLCPVVIGNMVGFIDKEGKIVINTIYSEASSFQQGRAVVTIDSNRNDLLPGLKGIIDKTGKMVVAPSFSEIVLDEDYFIAAQEKWGSGSFINLNRNFKYYKYNGDQLIQGEYTVSFNTGFAPSGDNPLKKNRFSEGLAFVCKGDSCGYIDEKGKIVIPFTFFPSSGDSEVFLNGLAAVGFDNNQNTSQGEKTMSHRSVGVINNKGQIVIPPDYVSIRIYPNGIIGVLPKEFLSTYISYHNAFYIDYSGRPKWTGRIIK